MELETQLYKKITGKTKIKLDFTLFDREFIISLGEEMKELREVIKGQNEFILELENRLKEVEK